MKAPSERAKTLLKRGSGVFALFAAAFAGGYELVGRDGDADAESTSFHDMRVVSLPEFTGLVDTKAAAVRDLARQLGTLENAYLHVRDRIRYSPSIPLAAPSRTLQSGAGSCLSKAVLLASLYRALGMGHEEVRVVTGQAYWQDHIVEHAWLEIEHEGRCLQQDPTTLFGTFGFDEFPGTSYTKEYVRREFFCFNDAGFAVISLNNRFRGMADPHQVTAGDP